MSRTGQREPNRALPVSAADGFRWFGMPWTDVFHLRGGKADGSFPCLAVVYSEGMRRSPAIIVTVLLALTVAGCATPKETSAGSPTSGVPSPAQTAAESDPVREVIEAGSADGEARAQARAWLDAAALPEGAVPGDARVARFNSSTGWPCGPVAELEAFWSIPGATVSETANWIRQHPSGDLITTAIGPVPDDPMYVSAIVGYVPAEGAQEGIVYTVQKTAEGVAVRAEVAAQAAEASCPDLPDDVEYGEPGQG